MLEDAGWLDLRGHEFNREEDGRIGREIQERRESRKQEKRKRERFIERFIVIFYRKSKRIT